VVFPSSKTVLAISAFNKFLFPFKTRQSGGFFIFLNITVILIVTVLSNCTSETVVERLGCHRKQEDKGREKL
ncbi:hypothetical protein, partial [uncultured Bartonella sp.]|uniref:hypothetical protein n=1 Tax=uncultured Bartonella sp. TaxID=104108 RepID=UPI0025FAF673